MQAAYFLERLGYLRLDAEASRAKLYVDLQRTVNTGGPTRARDMGGLLRAKEAEAATLDRLAEAVLDRLIALRSRLLTPTPPTRQTEGHPGARSRAPTPAACAGRFTHGHTR